MPEIKTILSGIALEDYLHWRNLVAKVVGMAVAAGSGTIIGKPLSHAGAVLASVLLKIPLFHRMNSVRQRLVYCIDVTHTHRPLIVRVLARSNRTR